MTPLQFETMIIQQTHKPMQMHTIELLEPVERCACVVVNWAVKYYGDNSPFPAFEVYLSTLGMDGVQ